jgi:hypothetical protein
MYASYNSKEEFERIPSSFVFDFSDVKIFLGTMTFMWTRQISLYLGDGVITLHPPDGCVAGWEFPTHKFSFSYFVVKMLIGFLVKFLLFLSDFNQN